MCCIYALFTLNPYAVYVYLTWDNTGVLIWPQARKSPTWSCLKLRASCGIISTAATLASQTRSQNTLRAKLYKLNVYFIFVTITNSLFIHMLYALSIWLIGKVIAQFTLLSCWSGHGLQQNFVHDVWLWCHNDLIEVITMFPITSMTHCKYKYI